MKIIAINQDKSAINSIVVDSWGIRGRSLARGQKMRWSV